MLVLGDSIQMDTAVPGEAYSYLSCCRIVDKLTATHQSIAFGYLPTVRLRSSIFGLFVPSGVPRSINTTVRYATLAQRYETR